MSTISLTDTALETLHHPTASSGIRTPTTPRPAIAQPAEPSNDTVPDESTLKTPIGQFFGEDATSMALTTDPVTPMHGHERVAESTPSLKRDGSHRSPPPEAGSAAQDVEMADGDDDIGVEDDGSDNDSVTSDSQRPSKKKKGQRFFCTEFPPCQLSFTRSEHLARHIRKHTGERPFQCHCSRRFSRLDNLRQHAQTVHLNEEIPGDSLAATSTRFQRQIRTDRVRPPANRSRASTIGSNGGHSRGHSRNLSTSSIASTASSIAMSEDNRRRPQPLAMANDPSSRARLSLDTFNNMAPSPNHGQYAYYNQSPSGHSSPTSTTFSMGTGSPRFQSGMPSPASTISRSSFYNGARHGRRLSVPSGPKPFQSPSANTYPPPMYFAPMGMGSPAVYPQNSSVMASPTNSIFSHGRRDSESELEFRRRTWHPSTYSNFLQRPPTSGLSYHQTPDDHHPAASAQPAASQVTRLPGIESFDHAPLAGSRPPSDPMVGESSPRPPMSARPSDAGLHQNLTRLDIAAANGPMEGQWQHPQHMTPQQAHMAQQQPTTVAPQHIQPPPSFMAEPPSTPRRNKRQAWYGGPVSGPVTPQSKRQSAHRPSPEDSGSSDGVPTPGTSQGIVEYHPVIINPHGGGTEAYLGATAAAAVVPDEHPKVYHREEQFRQGAPKSAATTTRADSGYQAYDHHPHHHHPQPPQTYALQMHPAGHDPRFAGMAGFTTPPPAAAPAMPQSGGANDMGRLEALVAVATSEGRAAAADRS